MPRFRFKNPVFSRLCGFCQLFKFNDPARLFARRIVPESEHHIRRPFKEANISFPAHPALTMLQTNELLFHLSSAARADLIVLSHRFHYPNCFRPAGSHRRSSSDPHSHCSMENRSSIMRSFAPSTAACFCTSLVYPLLTNR